MVMAHHRRGGLLFSMFPTIMRLACRMHDCPRRTLLTRAGERFLHLVKAATYKFRLVTCLAESLAVKPTFSCERPRLHPPLACQNPV
jgi:hypothetical protein